MRLQVATGKTLTISGPFEAGLYQVFDCVGTGKVLFSIRSIKEGYPEWWGAVADYVTDDYLAIQAALDTIYFSGGGTVKLVGSYLSNTTLKIQYGVNVKGNSSYSSKIKKDSTTTLALTAAELEASALVIYDPTGAGTPIAPMSTALPSDINAIIILNNTTDGRYIGTISDLTFF